MTNLEEDSDAGLANQAARIIRGKAQLRRGPINARGTGNMLLEVTTIPVFRRNCGTRQS